MEEHERWSRLYGEVYTEHEAARTLERIAALDRGEPVRCRGYEIDFTPAGAYVEVHADGTVTLVDP